AVSAMPRWLASCGTPPRMRQARCKARACVVCRDGGAAGQSALAVDVRMHHLATVHVQSQVAMRRELLSSFYHDEVAQKRSGTTLARRRYFARCARKSSNSSTTTGFVKWYAKPAAWLLATSSGAP